MHALCTVLGDTGSYPSQFDQSHLRDDYGAFGSEYEGYIGDPYGRGEYKVKVRPAPSTGDQPYGKPSQYDKVERTERDEADGGRYNPYAPGRARETDYVNRSGPSSRQKTSQFDQKLRTGQGRGNDERYTGYRPDSGLRGPDTVPRSPRQPTSQFDKAYQHPGDRTSGGLYKGNAPVSSTRVPTRTGKPGKPGKMERHFPVREKSGNFEQTGKVREKSGKTTQNTGKIRKFEINII